MSIKLIRPQVQFLNLKHKFRAYVAGYRGGKTWAGCTGLVQHVNEYPKVPLGYYAPTYPLIRDIFYPTIDKVAHAWGMTTTISQSNKEVHLFHGRWYYGSVICRSMENPAKLIGFEVGSALADEIDTLPIIKARAAWDKIIARNSVVFAGLNRVDVATTPEGFAFTYHRFLRDLRDNPEQRKFYGLIQASTYENEVNLPADYIPSLLATYPENLIKAYLYGQFVNLRQGPVYPKFDRKLNASIETIKPGEPLHIGLDFNVGKMAGVVHVLRAGATEAHAVDEIVNAYDTPEMIRLIQERYWKYFDGRYQKDREIRIYPDSSGGSRSSNNAATTDIALLKAAGFMVLSSVANPPVRDRTNSLNAMICNAENVRRYFVNLERCPTVADHLEQQPYTEQGEPDKRNGMDHTNDGIGYFIFKYFPLRRPMTRLKMRVAM